MIEFFENGKRRINGKHEKLNCLQSIRKCKILVDWGKHFQLVIDMITWIDSENSNSEINMIAQYNYVENSRDSAMIIYTSYPIYLSVYFFPHLKIITWTREQKIIRISVILSNFL